MSEKRITLEMIDALIAKSLAKVNGEPPVTRAKDFIDYACDAMEKPTPIIAKGPASKPQPLKRMDPAIQMRKEMNRLGIKSDDKRQFTVDLAGRLMYYGDDHIPRYVETDTRTPPGEAVTVGGVLYPSGIVPPERAVETAARDGRALVRVPIDPTSAASVAQEARFKAAQSSRDDARIKAKRWKRGDKVQMGEGDEHDTGVVESALEHMVRVKWNKVNAIYNEDPKDLEWWDGLERAKPNEGFDTMSHQQPPDRADELRTEVIPSEAWWCNTCEGSFNLTAADEATSPSCPSCGETLAIHEVAKSRWVRVGRMRTSEPPKVITTPEGFKARVVTPRSTEDKLHEWHREHGGEASLPNRDK